MTKQCLIEFYLDGETKDIISEIAARKQVAFADIIRESIDNFFKQNDLKQELDKAKSILKRAVNDFYEEDESWGDEANKLLGDTSRKSRTQLYAEINDLKNEIKELKKSINNKIIVEKSDNKTKQPIELLVAGPYDTARGQANYHCATEEEIAIAGFVSQKYCKQLNLKLEGFDKIIKDYLDWLTQQAEYFIQNPQVNETFLDCFHNLLDRIHTNLDISSKKAARDAGKLEPFSDVNELTEEKNCPMKGCLLRNNHNTDHELDHPIMLSDLQKFINALGKK